MNSIELNVTNRTSKGGVHVQVKADNDDIGILYLTKEQYVNISNLLQVGCFNKDIDFSVNDPYNDEE
jgi:hypothetical protein